MQKDRSRRDKAEGGVRPSRCFRDCPVFLPHVIYIQAFSGPGKVGGRVLERRAWAWNRARLRPGNVGGGSGSPRPLPASHVTR